MVRKRALTKKAQYSAVYKSGKAWVDDLVVIKALPNELEFSRYGYSVVKEIGKAAVRNRVRRLLKEITRVMPVKSGWDMVFIARSSSADADYDELKESVAKLLSRAHLINRDEAVCAGVN